MAWNKPQKIWQWLALLSPGALSLAMTAFGKIALSRQDEIAPSIVGVVLIFPISVAIAFILARGAGSPGKMIALAFLFTILLVVVNFSIAFGGCALMQPHLDIR